MDINCAGPDPRVRFLARLMVAISVPFPDLVPLIHALDRLTFVSASVPRCVMLSVSVLIFV